MAAAPAAEAPPASQSAGVKTDQEVPQKTKKRTPKMAQATAGMWPGAKSTGGGGGGRPAAARTWAGAEAAAETSWLGRPSASISAARPTLSSTGAGRILNGEPLASTAIVMPGLDRSCSTSAALAGRCSG